MTACLDAIYRYPVKGLSPERLETVPLSPGATLPSDRRFALALGSTPVSGSSTEWMPKSRFLALVRNAKLATLETSYDDGSETLTVRRQGRQVARGKLTDRIGRSMIEDFFAAYMGDEARGRPKLVQRAPDGALTDQEAPVVSVINLASVRDLERVVGQPVDPLRFRGNFYIDGIEPWAEFGWLEQQISIGDVRFGITERIDRCAAVNVNPESAERDLNIVASLQRGFGHIDMGVFATIDGSGAVTAGDGITLP